MTYLEFLALYLVTPLVLLGLASLYDSRKGHRLPPTLNSWPAWGVLLLHILIAVVYTTPWDNYLVATRVWSYDPGLVAGLTLGWVPLEEYAFFILQTTLTGGWLLFLARRFRPIEVFPKGKSSLRRLSTLSVFLIWAGGLLLWGSSWASGTYLGLELAWALPPVMVQLAFGADILWHYRRIVGLALGPPVLYLSLADSMAIRSGTWTINPAQSTGILLGSLPAEELIFFLLTNTLIVFGMILLMARESQERLPILHGIITQGGPSAWRQGTSR